MFIRSLKVDMFLPSGHKNETESWRQIVDSEREDGVIFFFFFYTGSLTSTEMYISYLLRVIVLD